MKLPAIKNLVEQFQKEQLNEAIGALENEEVPGIDIQGEDEGEKLTHAIAAIWVIEDMAANNKELKRSLRDYVSKVRDSIN